MDDMWMSFVIGVLNGVAFVCDILTYLPWYFVDKPDLTIARSRRIRARPTKSGDQRSPYRSTESFDRLITSPFPGCETLDDMFKRAVQQFGPCQCLGMRDLIAQEDEIQPNGRTFKKDVLGDYHWLTYDDVSKRVTRLGLGLLSLGLKRKSVVCIYAETRAEWMITALSCFKYNLPVMTLYSTLGDNAIVHGINETGVTMIITSADLLPKFNELLVRVPNVKHLVYMGGLKATPPSLNTIPHESVTVHSMQAVEELGEKKLRMMTPEDNDNDERPTKNDLAVIMYTSGSTGLPKGVLISHSNLLSAMAGQADAVSIGPVDTYIGYLPLAHVLELDAELACISHGVRIGYSSPNTLTDQSTRIKRGCKGDATVLQPTLMAAVPVIMDRILKGIMDKMTDGSSFKQVLFLFAFEYKAKHYYAGFRTPLMDRFIFSKTRSILGGKIRQILSGGAPLSLDTQRFMNVCFCCPVGQGYGLTETCGAGTIHEASDRSTGRVGAPLNCNEIKLVNWEEGGYTTDDKPYPRGEIWIGGGNISLGYYHDTVNSNTEHDGFYTDSETGQRWFATGDIGVFHPDGCLQIIDRKKDLVKLAGGEYIGLGRIETVLKLCPIVDNVCVCADSSSMHVVCLVTPNARHLRTLAETSGLDQSLEWQHLCSNAKLTEAVLKALQQHSVKSKLEKMEIPQAVKLCTEIWTPDSGLVTESYKLKRRVIESFYSMDIKLMYGAGAKQ